MNNTFNPDIIKKASHGFIEFDKLSDTFTFFYNSPYPLRNSFAAADVYRQMALLSNNNPVFKNWLLQSTDCSLELPIDDETCIVFQINRHTVPALINFVNDTGGIKESVRIKKSEAYKKAILDNIGEIFMLIAPDYKILEINKTAYEEIKTHLNIEMTPGCDARDMVIAPEKSSFEAHFSKALHGEEAGGIREIVVGNYRIWNSFRFNPVHAPDGGIFAVAFNSKDVTALMTNEHNLNKHIALVDALLAGIPDKVLKINSNGDITDIKEHENLSNFDMERPVFKHVNDFSSSPESLHLIKENIKTAIQTNKTCKVNFSRFEKDRNRHYEIRVCKSAENEAIALLRDVTEHKNTETELIKAKLLAEESNRLKSNLLANISHEVRTPLNGIMGLAQVIKQEYSYKELTGYVNLQIQCCKRLLDTFNNIIELSIAEEDISKEHFTTVDLGAMFITVCEAFAAANKNRDLSFEYHLEENELFTVWAERKITEKIIRYILDNSFKFTESGHIKAAMSGVIYQNKPFVRITVKDTGVGMTRDFLEKVFLPFEQESSGQKRLYEGSGLGLPIVKKYINLLGGDIFVESQKGRGTTFSLLIPLHS